jgi:hypothetical protein
MGVIEPDRGVWRTDKATRRASKTLIQKGVEQRTPSRHPHNPWILLKPPILIRENLPGEDQTSDYWNVFQSNFDLGVCASTKLKTCKTATNKRYLSIPVRATTKNNTTIGLTDWKTNERSNVLHPNKHHAKDI